MFVIEYDVYVCEIQSDRMCLHYTTKFVYYQWSGPGSLW